MPERSLLEIFTRPLRLNGIPYVVTGSMASIIYGEPRLTHDVDLVLDIKVGDVEAFMKLFPLDQFYCPPEETLLLETKRESRAHFNLIHHETGFKADCYVAGCDELHRWALERKKEIKLPSGDIVAVAPAEYVILRKLEYYREGGSEKHVRDIQGMLKISGGEIGLNFIEAEVHKLGLEKEWAKCKKS